MRFRPLSLLAGALALAASARASAAGVEGIFEPVLAYETALSRERTPVCVQPLTEGGAFDGDRERLRSLRAARAGNPRDSAALRSALAARENPTYDWRRPVPLREGRVDAAPQLDPALSSDLSAAARTIVRGDPPEARPIPVPAGTLRAPLRAAGSLADCARLTLTAPAFAGDLAFVETSYDCGGLCGNGWLYALRRDGDRWRLVAIAFTWIS